MERQISEQSSDDSLWSGNVKGTQVEIKRVTPDNVAQAIDIAAQCFPGELGQVAKLLHTSAVSPPLLQASQNAHASASEHYMLYAKGEPVGITGLYVPANHPQEAWRSLTGMTFSHAQSGLDKVLDNFARENAKSQGFEYILGDNLTNFRYADYPAVEKSAMLGEIRAAEQNFTARGVAVQTQRGKFLQEFGGVDQYLADGRLVDLSGKIAKQVHDSQTESFSRLNNRLFPVEEERENVFGDSGLKLYVQKDHLEKYAANERRVLAVLDEKKENVIGAIVYGIAALPFELARKEGVDAVMGVTYLMVDDSDRAKGLGKALFNAALERSAEFLRQNTSVENPKIMTMTEQNNPYNMTVRNYVNDFAGALIAPMQRLKFWGGSGVEQRLIGNTLEKGDVFPYIQVSLREGLEPCEGLGLHVAVPGKKDQAGATISSDLLRYAVKVYADLCLNKQQRMIELDPSWRSMEQALNTRTEWGLADRFTQNVAPDGNLRAATVQAATGGIVQGQALREDMTMGEVLTAYRAKIKAANDTHQATPPAGRNTKGRGAASTLQS
jgi:GNAT superfamily N-acetyltransferase